jgi:hypothetical protein
VTWEVHRETVRGVGKWIAIAEIWRDGRPVRRPVQSPREPSTYLVSSRSVEREKAEQELAANIGLLIKSAKREGAI